MVAKNFLLWNPLNFKEKKGIKEHALPEGKKMVLSVLKRMFRKDWRGRLIQK